MLHNARLSRALRNAINGPFPNLRFMVHAPTPTTGEVCEVVLNPMDNLETSRSSHSQIAIAQFIEQKTAEAIRDQNIELNMDRIRTDLDPQIRDEPLRFETLQDIRNQLVGNREPGIDPNPTMRGDEPEVRNAIEQVRLAQFGRQLPQTTANPAHWDGMGTAGVRTPEPAPTPWPEMDNPVRAPRIAPWTRMPEAQEAPRLVPLDPPRPPTVHSANDFAAGKTGF